MKFFSVGMWIGIVILQLLNLRAARRNWQLWKRLSERIESAGSGGNLRIGGKPIGGKPQG